MHSLLQEITQFLHYKNFPTWKHRNICSSIHLGNWGLGPLQAKKTLYEDDVNTNFEYEKPNIHIEEFLPQNE